MIYQIKAAMDVSSLQDQTVIPKFSSFGAINYIYAF